MLMAEMIGLPGGSGVAADQNQSHSGHKEAKGTARAPALFKPGRDSQALGLLSSPAASPPGYCHGRPYHGYASGGNIGSEMGLHPAG